MCEQFAAVCESAVHPLEIAGALEFDGWNDAALRERYGVSDVFTLADEMYRRVPRRPGAPPPQPDPWPASHWRPAAHGLLYAIPAICYAAAAALLTGPGTRTVTTTALLTSWTLSQALAYLGYLRLGQGTPAQARRVLLAGLAAGLAAVTTAMTIMAVAAPVPVLIFGTATGAYMLSATVLLVLGQETRLALALTPGVIAGTAYLLAGRPHHLTHPTWAILATTPLLTLTLALAQTTPRTRTPKPKAQRTKLVSAADLRAALPSAGFGLVAGGLLVFPVSVAAPGHATGALVALLPLTLSMGAAEWMLVWFRRRTQHAMRSTGTLTVFAARARLLLAAVVAQYLAVTVLLTAAVIAVAAGTGLGHLQWAALPQIATYLALGCALFISLLLNAFGSRLIPVIAGTTALAIEITCYALGANAQVSTCTALLAVLAAYAATILGNAARHAC